VHRCRQMADKIDTSTPTKPRLGSMLEWVDYVEAPSSVVSRCAAPYYLKMMGGNARDVSSDVLGEIATMARATTDDETISLVRAEWRPCVMGAWIATTKSGPDVTNAVLTAMMRSLGTLTAPPLAVAAVTLADARALPALIHYYAEDIEHGYGSTGIIRAATQYVAETHHVENPLHAPSAQEVARFDALLDVAHILRVS
jgi:hypothetical protein